MDFLQYCYIRWLIIWFATLPWTFEPCKLWRLKGYADNILQHLCAICPLYYISLEEASKCHNFGKNYNPFSWLFWWSRDITPRNLVEYGIQSQSPGLEAFITPNHQLRRGICWILVQTRRPIAFKSQVLCVTGLSCRGRRWSETVQNLLVQIGRFSSDARKWLVPSRVFKRKWSISGGT